MRVRQSTITIGAGLAFAAMAIALIVSVLNVQSSSHELQKATEREHAFDRASTEVTTASDFLTNEVRSYAVSTDRAHLDAYWTEIDKTKGRDEAVADLKRNGAQKDELALIDEANANSDALVATETRAMWLVLSAAGTPASAMPPAVGEYRPSAADRALSSDAKLATARRILFDDKYLSAKASIGAPIDEFKRNIAARARGDVKAAEGARDSTITILLILSVLAALAMAGVLAVFHRGVGTVVSRYSAALRDRDQGDREFALDPAGTVELRELAGEFNSQFAANAAQLDENDRLVADLKNLVGEVTDASTTVNSAAQQMSATSAEAGRAVGEIANAVGDVAQGAERQVRQLESVRNSAADAATAARTSAEQARGATEAAEEARRHARDGVGAAERATEAMQSVRDSSQSVTEAIRELASRSDRIGAIVDTITGIAGQTNLLALNAAIEAARAGEQGRGFAVVAEEVRKLAEESQRAAEEISGLIAQIQSETQTAVGVVQDGAQRTEDGAATVDETRAAFERIGTAVEDVNARIAEIATATDQISSGTAKIQEEIAEVASVAQESSASTEQVSASTEQTSASTQEIAATAGELAATAGELERLVGQLRI